VDGFSITREDAKILGEYLDEFEDGDSDLRNTIVTNAMAVLSGRHPEIESFDKIEASKVSSDIIIRSIKANTLFRKFESGFIITILSQSDSTSSSPTGSPPGIHFTTCVGMKS
jgi:hypothetical protein